MNMNNKNSAILALGVALNANPKLLANQVDNYVDKVQEKVQSLEIDVDIKSVTDIFNKTQKLADKLKGIDVSGFYRDIFESISTKSLEDASVEIQKIHENLEKLAILKSKDYGIDLKILSDFNYKDLTGIITQLDKISKETESAISKTDAYRKSLENLSGRSIPKIKVAYGSDETYAKYKTEEFINPLTEKLGLKDNKAAKNEVKKLSELLGLYEILNNKKKEYFEANDPKNANAAVINEKNLKNVSDAIKEAREKFKKDFKVNKEIFDSVLPKDYKPTELNNIFNVINQYAEQEFKELENNINSHKAKLSESILQKSVAKKEISDEKLDKSFSKAKKKISNLQGISSKEELVATEESIINVGDAFQTLNDNLEDFGSRDGGSGDSTLDYWAKSAENLKEEFGELTKYAVSAEDALKQFNTLGSKIESGQFTKGSQGWKDFMSYGQRLLSLDNDYFDENENDYSDLFFINESEYEKQLNSIDFMTSKQLKEIEYLKSIAATPKGKPNAPTPSEDELDVSNEEINKLKLRVEELGSSISQMQVQLDILKQGDAFEKMKNDVQELKNELTETTQKLTELTKSSIPSSLDNELSKMGLNKESAIKLGKFAQGMINQDDKTGLLTANDNLLETTIEYHDKIKDTNAYIQQGNDLIEERAILLKNGLQVGNEYVMSDSTGKVDIGNGIDKYGADSVLHTHPFNENRNNLLFSDTDIRELLDGTVKKALLLCGNEIATLDMSGVDSSKFEDLKNDALGAYTAVFARFGAEVKDGKLIGIDKLSDEVYNKAGNIINNMLAGLMQNYGGSLLFDKIENKEFVENDAFRLPVIDSSELKIVQQFVDATTSDKPIENIIALQKQFGILTEEIKEAKQEIQEVEDKFIKKQNISFDKEKVTGIGYHGAKYAWDTENFDFNKTKAAQLGSGMYLTDEIEKVSNFGKGQIKQVELELEKCFVLTNDYFSDFSDLYKAMGKELPTADITAKKAIKDVRNYNKSSKENSDNFRQNMLSMGYQGMFVGDNLANKIIPTELVIYDEHKLDKLISFTNKEFQELINNDKIELLSNNQNNLLQTLLDDDLNFTDNELPKIIEQRENAVNELEKLSEKLQSLTNNLEADMVTINPFEVIEESSSNLGFIKELDKTNDLIEEESGQMALFKVESNKAIDTAVEGQKHLNDYIDQNIEGQMTLNDLLNQQESKSTAGKTNHKYNVLSPKIKNAKFSNQEIVDNLKQEEQVSTSVANTFIENENRKQEALYKTSDYSKDSKISSEDTKNNQKVAKSYSDLLSTIKEYFKLRERLSTGEFLPGEEKRLEELEKKYSDATQGLNEFLLSRNGSKSSISKIEDLQKRLSKELSSGYNDYITSYINKDVNKIVSQVNTDKYTKEYVEQMKIVEDLVGRIQAYLPIDFVDENDNSQLTEIVNIKKQIDNILSNRNSHKLAENTSINKLSADLSQIMRYNDGMSKDLMRQFESLRHELESYGDEIPIERLKHFRSEFHRLRGEMEKSNKLGKSFWGKVKDKLVYGWADDISKYFGLQDIRRYVEQIFSKIKVYNTNLTEMRKVSNETISTLEKFQDVSFDLADGIGATADAIQKSTADFMRLGYELEDADDLAVDANIYANVGDMEIEEATEHMISSIQAWKSEFSSEVEASAAIIDRYNEIGNNFAITSADIGSAMERSAAALKAGGNTLNESLGLITAGNLIQQDADTTANALKVVSLRIRGSKADLEAMGESTDDLAESSSKCREELKALTGVDIMLDEKTYKSTAQIIQEIGENWEKLSDVSKAASLELLAGKTRASVMAGLIENYEVIEDVIEAAENAEGSALRENERYLESIEGHIAVLSNAWDKFVTSLIDSGTINFFLDLATAVVNLGEKLVNLTSPLGMLASIGAGVASFNGLGLTNYVTNHSLRVPFYKVA